MASFIMSTIVLTLNTLPDLVDFVDGSDYPPFAVVEIATNIWFTAEFVARLFSCPSKLRWFLKFGRNLDFITFGFQIFQETDELGGPVGHHALLHGAGAYPVQESGHCRYVDKLSMRHINNNKNLQIQAKP